MDRLETMRVFVAVAEERGFAPAARRLAMSPAAVTRAIATLERRVGARLLQRTTRVVRLTETGARYFADCKRILEDVETAESAAAEDHSKPRGELVVTAPLVFGRMFVAPIVLEFLARHPQVTARTLLLDHVVDLVEGGVDVAVRIAHLPDSSLTATKVGTVRRVVCASPDYLAAHGAPRTPADLASHEAIVFSSPAAAPKEWQFGTEGGRSGSGSLQSVPLRSRFAVNNADAAIAAAVAGAGLTRVLSYQIGPQVRAGSLQIVLAKHEPAPIPVSVVSAAGRRSTAKVREFVAFAVERLKKAQWLA
jgi:DNA-binding transcriptional LysR family regulator